MRWLKRVSVGALALLMLAMLLVYLTPLNVYVPELERTLSTRLQAPVSIGRCHVAMLPLPHLELRDVLLGGSEGIAARSVEVSLSLPDLLAGRVAMHVAIRDGAAHLAQVSKLVESLSAGPVVEGGAAVRELWLSGVILLTPEMAFGPLDGKIEFAQGGDLQRVWFALDEQRLTAELSPLADGKFALQVRARNWIATRPVALPIDELQVDGVLGAQDFVAQRFSLAAQGVRLAGSGRLDFSEGWGIHAELDEAEVSLAQLMVLLGKPVGLSGSLSGRGRLDGRADTWGGLSKALQFVGNLRVADVSARVAESFAQPLRFEHIQAHVVAGAQRVELGELKGALYGGSLSGSMRIDRESEVLEATLAVQGVDMRHLVAALTDEVLFSGHLEGEAKFAMRLDRLDSLPENLNLAGKFHLRDGVLTKVDLVQAASNPGKAAGKGETRFDDLMGSLRVDASGYHFRHVKISSGSLNADGRVDIAPSLQIKGLLDADLKGTAGLVSMPLVLSGTLNEPVVRVSGSALAGAAVGTALLGPGLGTAVGVKVGGFLNKLFGGGRDKNDTGENAPVPGAAR